MAKISKREVDCVPYAKGCESLFLDSGSFTLWTKAAQFAKATGRDKWEFYDTDEFWKYVDAYAAFVHKYYAACDLYANMDVIPNPDLTWRNQQYLEDRHALTPVPVVHFRTDLKWLEKYIDRGHEFIALGGLVGSISKPSCKDWLNRAFNVICDQPSRLPRVKVHGFGVSSFSAMRKWPWWSVDSVRWTKQGGFGRIIVPKKRGGKFDFTTRPMVLAVSSDPKWKTAAGVQHLDRMNKGERQMVLDWLEYLNIPLGKCDPDGDVIEPGVTNLDLDRRVCNLQYYEHFRKTIPPWPWPFRYRKRPSFGYTAGGKR